MDHKTKDRLIKLCGMLGSAHDGEVLNAARKVHELVVSTGMTWEKIIGGAHTAPIRPQARPRPRARATNYAEHQVVANKILDKHYNQLSEKELGFVSDMTHWIYISPGQSSWLASLAKRFNIPYACVHA